MLDLSLIVPVFNEEAVLPEFARVVTETLAPTGLNYEIIFVNDGSSDGTARFLESLVQSDSRVKAIEFSRNFGHQSAMTAGLRAAKGNACVIMDADLQDPPSLLIAMVEKWREGYDVVYAVRRSRDGESVFKKTTAAVFYRLLRSLAGVDIPPDTGDFRLMDRRVVDVLNALPERNRFLRGLVSWIGFRQIGVPFDRPARAAGETKFSLWKMLRFAVDGLTAFSRVPLRLVTVAGVGAFVASGSVLGWALWVRLYTDRSVPGWASLMGVILLLGGTQLLALGIIGEYLAHIFDEAKARPMYVVCSILANGGKKNGE
ncbi:MAG: glycosyltransferase family 2 protein [Elusimicrobia bacterium]|nr:glycosyltransferase family 2 protein [Elusimicrobiota bacterium]MBP9699593.1 glycosyltransferase family 2 protein [Elusimicrobiota bacterium]